MQLSITHETHYEYAPPVDVAQHIACLQPRQTEAQQLLFHTLTIAPTPSQCKNAMDVFGNHRTFLSLQIPHTELKVTATSTVQTRTVLVANTAFPGSWQRVAENVSLLIMVVQMLPRRCTLATYGLR